MLKIDDRVEPDQALALLVGFSLVADAAQRERVNDSVEGGGGDADADHGRYVGAGVEISENTARYITTASNATADNQTDDCEGWGRQRHSYSATLGEDTSS